PDGRLLASAGWDSKVMVWNLTTGREAFPALRAVFVGSPWRVEFSPDGRLLAHVDNGSAGGVKVYDAAPGHPALPPLQAPATGVVYSLAFSPDGPFLVSGSVDNTAKVWNTQTYQEVRTLRGHTEGVWSVAFSQGGRLATASADKTVILWDAATGQKVRTFTNF